MYQLTTTSGVTHLTEKVSYIRKHGEGVYLLTDADRAEGFVYQGTPCLFSEGAVLCEVDAGEMVSTSRDAVGVAFVTLAESGSIDTVTAGEHTALFSPWAYPVNYSAGNLRSYNGALYKCLQDHQSQEGWTPDTAVSLWVRVSDPAEEWPAWSQPVGAHDAYDAGAKVTHNGKHWTSDVDANVWEPGVYGWTEVEA